MQILRGLYDEERPGMLFCRLKQIAILLKSYTDEPKATLCQLIGKVNLPTTLDSHSLLRLNLLVSNVEDVSIRPSTIYPKLICFPEMSYKR